MLLLGINQSMSTTANSKNQISFHLITATFSYPRTGKSRELKKVPEGFWRDPSNAANLIQTIHKIETKNWEIQQQTGNDRIGLSHASLDDHVLDWSICLGMVPQRSADFPRLERYFAMAGGTETLSKITSAGCRHQVGNGVYDVHSPTAPSTAQMVQQLKTGEAHLPVHQIRVNPDCGQKTRGWEEGIPALQNIVEATKVLRGERYGTEQ
ncbi:MAG: hypothetical protein HC919_05990 [Oscillatoriales cyanobacterium SM2_2_1]|nr:hypothetical protein [Oscillatoriales cyanobacterium SM2_2_1]